MGGNRSARRRPTTFGGALANSFHIRLVAGIEPTISEVKGACPNDHTISDHEVCPPGFDIIRRDRSVNGRHGGGICIYVRVNLSFKVRTELQSDILENLVVEIIKPQSKSILVSKVHK